MQKAILTALAGATLALSGAASANDYGAFENFKISGAAYFDFTQPVSDSGPRSAGDFSAFDFGRAYLTIDHKIDEQFAIRYRTDADHKGDDEKLRVFVKHAYLSWKGLVPDAKLYIGMAGTPTWSFYAEPYWAYRGLSKTLLDKFKDVTGTDIDVSSAALGVALKGSLADGMVGYHAFVSNGRGYGHVEDDKYKKVALQGSLHPAAGMVLAALVEYEPQNSSDNNVLAKGFAGYKSKEFTLGLEGFLYRRGADALANSSGFSAFAHRALGGNWTGIARVDFYEPDSKVNDDETTLLIGALDYSPNGHVHLMPNLYYYLNADSNADADVYVGVTTVFNL